MEKNIKFEDAVLRLEKIVESLESGNVPLDKALDLFGEGTELIKFCGKTLDDAQQLVVKLQKGADGEPIESIFEDLEQ